MALIFLTFKTIKSEVLKITKKVIFFRGQVGALGKKSNLAVARSFGKERRLLLYPEATLLCDRVWNEKLLMPHLVILNVLIKEKKD